MSRDSALDLGVVGERLAQRYGLDPAAIGPTVLASALSEVAQSLGSPAPVLLERLAEPACITALFNALPVGLSWFDRDVAQLRSAAVWAAAQRRPLRVLSAPCARGEEVWSLAAAMLDAGLDATTVQIVGVDAMHSAIERAESRCYPREGGVWTAAGLPWWLIESGTQLKVHSRLHPLARFQTANLLDPALADLGRFDLIFSRNFLIYLTPVARQQWIEGLNALLAPAGRVYVAAGEALARWSTGFSACPGEVPGACVAAGPRVATPAAPAAPLPLVARAPARRAPRPGTCAVTGAVASAPARPVEAPPEPRALADAGALELAEQRLAPRLALAVPAADDLVTAALIALARGQAERAEDALRRALYLDHRHAEAGELLAVLLDQRGESQGARRLRGRAGGGR
ncbi:MAG: hypothetical protein MUE46_02155 [Xanthomonadales bacterium]|jgi:chemotaxis protein methyltransferase WspC|nr:hypothetical protein [Xanthomonadales bacterium]